MFDEKEILNKCLKNDRKAQAALFGHYAPQLLGVCLRYAGERTAAEDILQEGFLKIFRHLPRFEGRSPLGAWMHRIIVNTAISYFHREQKHRQHLDVTDINDKQEAAGGQTDTEFTSEELLGIINSLPHGYRTIFNLYAIDGYKHKEIADMLNIDTNTSKSQYSRAKKLIREKLAELGHTDFCTNEDTDNTI